MQGSSSMEDAKDQLIADALKIADQRRGGASQDRSNVRDLLSLYYHHVAPEDILGRSGIDLYGAAMSHYRLAKTRPQGTAAVRVFAPSIDDNEWAAEGHSVIEVVTDDMPFLVDSVTMALTAEDRAVHVVIHPQLLVRRDVTGELRELSDGDGAEATQETDLLRESWMHIEIERDTDPAELERIEQTLLRGLRDVREAVEDWTKMGEQARRIVRDLESQPPPLPPAEVAEGRALLEWLADDHFTFLGYREYQLQTVEGEDVLRAIAGTGLGILRADQDMSPSYGKLPPDARVKAREKELLIITKANSRSTVHRPVYLDYVGVKAFDESGEVCGERRFLGLFSSAAYHESLMRIPVLREKAAQLLDMSGFSALSHSGKALMDILETYPRDELFQTPVAELLPVTRSVLHLRERRQLRLFVRRDTYGRYLSCLVYLPRDRYTTRVRERMQQILKATLKAETVDFTARVSESVLARLHFVARAVPGTTLPDFDEAALEQKLAEATRSWGDDLAVALTDQFGEGTGARLVRIYGDAFPEAYKEDFPPRVAAADVRRMEEVGDAPIALSLYEPFDAAEGEARVKVFRTSTPLSLSDVLPVLSAMGVEVVDERPYEMHRSTGPAWIYDFGLRRKARMPAGAKALFQSAFMAVWSGRAESDGFSALVLEGCIEWRQVSILRAYAKYFRQGGLPYSQEYIELALRANVPIAHLLVQL
ncbi:MAG: NAD-glutamate dehydrogenase, partial [Nocardioidaceae bacterium]|nr:NAD-glutamate dehydrogenase [Nocardioidaceae bacterium]